jgi:hypothetical protein
MGVRIVRQNKRFRLWNHISNKAVFSRGWEAPNFRNWYEINSSAMSQCRTVMASLYTGKWIPATRTRRVLRLRIKQTARGYGGWLRIYWISILGQLKGDGPPTWWLGDVDNNSPPCIIGALLNVTQGFDRAGFLNTLMNLGFLTRWGTVCFWKSPLQLLSKL